MDVRELAGDFDGIFTEDERAGKIKSRRHIGKDYGTGRQFKYERCSD